MKYKLGVFAFTTDAEIDHINEQLAAMLKVIESKYPHHSINNASFTVERWDSSSLHDFDAVTTFRTEEGAQLYARAHSLREDEVLACCWEKLGDNINPIPAFVPFGCTQRIALADAIVNEIFQVDPTARIETAYDYINCRSLTHLRKVGRRFKDL